VNNSMPKDGSLSRKSGPPGRRRTESLFHLLALTCLISACGGGSSNPPPPPQTYTVGGGVTGLSAGDSLVLQENGGGNTTVTANGNFTLPTALTSGATFKVTVLTLPSGKGCSVANGSGTVAASAVNNIVISCGVPNLALLAGNAGGAGNADATGSVARFNLQLAVPTGYPWLNRYGAAYGQGAVALDVEGNVWVADSGNETIRKISPSGVVTTVAGKAGVKGSIDGAGPDARFQNPTGIAIDHNGNAYIADTGNNVIRKISPAGTVSTFAGTVGVVGASDGLGAAASFHLAVESFLNDLFSEFPRGRGALAVDGNGNVFVADSGNSTIRQITPAGMVSTLAGKAGVVGGSDGVGAAASFACPSGIATDKTGNVYVADSMNYPGNPPFAGSTIRQVTPTGTVTTIAGTVGTRGSSDGVGTAASFVLPTGVTTDGLGNIYVADNLGNTIRKIAPGGVVSTSAGSPSSAGSADGTGADARFNLPSSLASDGAGNIYVVDAGNNTVRAITPTGVVTTFSGAAAVAGSADGAGAGATFNSPVGVATDSAGNLYVADSGSNLIRKVTSSGTVTTFAGTAGQSGSADGTAATFLHPTGVTADAAGNVYVADSYNEEIRKITPAGVVSTLAGNPGGVNLPGFLGGSADGTGANATFQLSIIFRSPTTLLYPTCHGGVAADTAGNVYVADCGNDTIRKVTASGVVTTLAGVAGMADGTDGTGPGAHFSHPTGVATDSVGNIYVADAGNNTIRKVTPAGVVTTVAGTAGVAGSADGTGSAASFNDPESVTVDDSGNLYVADTGNSTVRKITPAGVVTTVLGVPGVVSFSPGGLPGLLSSPVGVAISGGMLFVTTGNGIAIATYVP
jgi:sugar lactone lactonase YvrE